MRRVSHIIVGCSALLVGACGDEVAAYMPPPQSPMVVQNIDYTTNVYNTSTAALPPPTSAITILPPPAPEVLARNVKPVGIASCDAYLTHVEVCSRRMLSRLPINQDDAITKIVMSLDMSRRAWRNAVPEMTSRARASLAETCSDSIRLYDMSAASSCAE